MRAQPIVCALVSSRKKSPGHFGQAGLNHPLCAGGQTLIDIISFAAPMRVLKKVDPRLLSQNKMRAPVHLPALFRMLGADRTFLAPTGCFHPVGGDAERDQEVLGCFRTALAESKIIFGRAAFVAIAFNRDAHLRVGPKEFRILGEDAASLAAE